MQRSGHHLTFQVVSPLSLQGGVDFLFAFSDSTQISTGCPEKVGSPMLLVDANRKSPKAQGHRLVGWLYKTCSKSMGFQLPTSLNW